MDRNVLFVFDGCVNNVFTCHMLCPVVGTNVTLRKLHLLSYNKTAFGEKQLRITDECFKQMERHWETCWSYPGHSRQLWNESGRCKRMLENCLQQVDGRSYMYISQSEVLSMLGYTTCGVYIMCNKLWLRFYVCLLSFVCLFKFCFHSIPPHGGGLSSYWMMQSYRPLEMTWKRLLHMIQRLLAINNCNFYFFLFYLFFLQSFLYCH